MACIHVDLGPLQLWKQRQEPGSHCDRQVRRAWPSISCSCKTGTTYFFSEHSHFYIYELLRLLFLNICHALQVVPEKSKESPGEPWEFVGLLPLLDPPRSDSADTITRALNLGVNVKMITGTFRLSLYNSTTLHYRPEKLFKLTLL
jgi:hypothetical protein